MTITESLLFQHRGKEYKQLTNDSIFKYKLYLRDIPKYTAFVGMLPRFLYHALIGRSQRKFKYSSCPTLLAFFLSKILCHLLTVALSPTSCLARHQALTTLLSPFVVMLLRGILIRKIPPSLPYRPWGTSVSSTRTNKRREHVSRSIDGKSRSRQYPAG